MIIRFDHDRMISQDLITTEKIKKGRKGEFRTRSRRTKKELYGKIVLWKWIKRLLAIHELTSQARDGRPGMICDRRAKLVPPRFCRVAHGICGDQIGDIGPVCD